jgi:HD-GYP domain-containing protein (c-di-GMP phosphodiesterase class II)
MPLSEPQRERVPIDELRDLIRLGEALPFRLLDADERLLLGEGQVVASERQFEQLHERGAWAERDRVDAARAAAAGDAPARPPTLFDKWEALVWDLDATLQRIVQGTAMRRDVEQLAVRALHLLDRDPDAAIFLAVRQDDRRFSLYALTHSLHTVTFAALAARQLGLASERVQRLACAALSMNAAIVRLQGQLAEQRDPPTLRQREAIERHPLDAAQQLRAIGVDDPAWLETVEQHHEQPGGGGYPRGLTAPGEDAQLVRLADMLVAKITPRAHRPALDPRVATRDVYLADPDKRLATALVRVLGVYPPGSIVQLKSGEVGVVVRRAAGGRGPFVHLLAGAPSRSPTERVVDSAEPARAIAREAPMPAGVARIYPEQVYGIVTDP